MNNYNSDNSKHNSTLTPRAKELRKQMTKEEKHLWYDYLRNYPIRFLRQKVIDQYIVDFYCHDARLIIELDGSQHYLPTGIIKDQIRTSQLNKRNLIVIRIPNNLVFSRFKEVCGYIDDIVVQQVGYDPWVNPPVS